jgi:hypothetical protein
MLNSRVREHVQTSLQGTSKEAGDNKIFLLSAETSITEEPGAIVPHAGIREGAAG